MVSSVDSTESSSRIIKVPSKDVLDSRTCQNGILYKPKDSSLRISSVPEEQPIISLDPHRDVSKPVKHNVFDSLMKSQRRDNNSFNLKQDNQG